MYYLSLNVCQEDCPLTQATREHDVWFITPHWRFEKESSRWKLRIHAEASERQELEDALRRFQNVKAVHQFHLQKKRGTTAFLRTVVAETDTIDTVERHGGYVVGPFQNAGGRERWHLGFDTQTDADDALAELDRNEEFRVRNRRRITDPEAFDPLHYHETAQTLLEGVVMSLNANKRYWKQQSRTITMKYHGK
ncbi:helix-turn-helix domain-containing protein [Halocatena marina]|uniref:helix-turn-helix domain-containing protein n=1 Tax=Halocatena marina TaxID=2934937 RepID=UPI003611B80D